jgi:hypothetical protein
MKKILLSTIVLLAFTVSILLFQISCKKEAKASPAAAVNAPQNKIIFIRNFEVTSPAATTYSEIWIANNDGSNPQKLNITLPSGIVVGDGGTKLSADGKTIFFTAYTPSKAGASIYGCNLDGSNVHLVIDKASSTAVSTSVGDTF